MDGVAGRMGRTEGRTRIGLLFPSCWPGETCSRSKREMPSCSVGTGMGPSKSGCCIGGNLGREVERGNGTLLLLPLGGITPCCVAGVVVVVPKTIGVGRCQKGLLLGPLYGGGLCEGCLLFSIKVVSGNVVWVSTPCCPD